MTMSFGSRNLPESVSVERPRRWAVSQRVAHQNRGRQSFAMAWDRELVKARIWALVVDLPRVKTSQ
jgi:hypothetical protein